MEEWSKTITPAGRPVAARDLDRVLDRLRARVDEQRALLVAAAGRELREPPADLDVRLVHPDHEALVQVAVDLFVDRGTAAGRPWPVFWQPSPPAKSMYSRPSIQTRAPSARSTTNGGVDTPRATYRCRDDAVAGPHFLQRHGAIHPTNWPSGQETRRRNRRPRFGRFVEPVRGELAGRRLAIAAERA